MESAATAAELAPAGFAWGNAASSIAGGFLLLGFLLLEGFLSLESGDRWLCGEGRHLWPLPSYASEHCSLRSRPRDEVNCFGRVLCRILLFLRDYLKPFYI